MYPVLSTVLFISTISATLAECFKKRSKKPPLVLEQAKPEQPMDQPPQPKSVSNITEFLIEPPFVLKLAKPEQSTAQNLPQIYESNSAATPLGDGRNQQQHGFGESDTRKYEEGEYEWMNFDGSESYDDENGTNSETFSNKAKTPNIAAMDNETIVETFKFLNYYQLATSSLVSKKFWNQIRIHRHKLALLHVNRICISKGFANQDPVIKMFNEELSPEKYSEWIVRSGYLKQIPLEGQISGKECTENVRDVFEMIAVSQNQKHSHEIATAVFYVRVELKDENWTLFQHFIRLIMDSFIYIRTLSLIPQKDVFSLLTGAMNPDRNRLECKQLIIYFNGDTQKFIVWIKDHVRCDEFVIYGDGNSNYDEEMLDLFQTGARCTSAIYVRNYYPAKVIADLLKKFVGLKNGDEYQLVESTFGDVKDRQSIENLKRNFAEFIAEEEQYEENLCTLQVIRFINNNIGKKLTLCVKNFSYGIPSSFSIIIISL